MRNFEPIIISVLIMIFFESCYKEKILFNSEISNHLELSLILKINNKDCVLDYEHSTLRYPIREDSIVDFEVFIEFQDYSTVYFNGKLLENNQFNNLGDIKINKEYSVKIITNNTTKYLTLKFTNLPIVQIITPNQIYDDPKSLARLIVNYPDINQASVSSYIGIEQRGGYHTLQLQKRSYGFSFLNSIYTDDQIPRSLFNLESNSNWILDGMITDNLKGKNKIASNIWLNIPGEKHFGIQLSYIELFINNEHQGLYCLGEKINNELLNLSNNEALLYKAIGWTGPRCFEESSAHIPTIDRWDGWVQKYPFPNQRINWVPLAELRNLIVNSNDEKFISEISNNIDIDNFIDYYLFLNLIGGEDNLGKNIYLTRSFISDPLSIIPWDYDKTFSTSLIISNNRLYQRLITLNPINFNQKLKDRWFSLRNNNFSADNLLNIFETTLNQLDQSNIIQIENNKWNTNINIQEEHIIINTWLLDRLNRLDDYYLSL